MINYKCQEGWETLKDHPIDRAGDLKHRPISGGAPKNAFFLFLCKTHLTLDDKDAIEAARKAYDSLDADEKALVTTETVEKLTDVEAAYKNLVDTAAANAVIEKINALPSASDVTENDRSAIEAARAAYNALTPGQKAKVPAEVLEKLTDDENALASLKPATPEKQGLPAGAVVGIVIGSIFGVLLIACLVLFLLNKKGIINLPFLNKKK